MLPGEPKDWEISMLIIHITSFNPDHRLQESSTCMYGLTCVCVHSMCTNRDIVRAGWPGPNLKMYRTNKCLDDDA